MKKLTSEQARRKSRLFFWLALAVLVLPQVAVVSAFFPFMDVANGVKWGVGILVLVVNIAVSLVFALFRAVFKYLPFFNVFALTFLLLAGFFLIDAFRAYVTSFVVIEAVAFISGLAASVFHLKHEKYKRKYTLAKDMKAFGVEVPNDRFE